jgi:hypothetical protein
MAFLHECDRRKPIIPKGNFQRKFAAVKRTAGFKGGVSDSKQLKAIEAEPDRKPWIPDGTRHSDITYHVRQHGDIYKTATAAGNSPGVIKAHYEGAATSSTPSPNILLSSPPPACSPRAWTPKPAA